MGFDGGKRMQHEQKLKTFRSDLEEAKRSFLKVQDRYIVQKNKETMMGANLEEAVRLMVLRSSESMGRQAKTA